MKVHIDEDKCVASGACVLEAPEVFDQDDDGIIVMLDGQPADGQEDAVRRAAAVCPAAVIRVQEWSGEA